MNHVPIVPLIVTPRWELAENRPLCVWAPFASSGWWPDSLKPAPSTTCRSGAAAFEWISPASYALLIRILHWVIWPLAIASFAARIQRRSG